MISKNNIEKIIRLYFNAINEIQKEGIDLNYVDLDEVIDIIYEEQKKKDMSSDIDDLYNRDLFQQADELHDIYSKRFIEFANQKKLKQLVSNYEKKYKTSLDEYGIL